MDTVRSKLESVLRELSLLLPNVVLNGAMMSGSRQVSYRFFLDQTKNQFLLLPSGAETSHVVQRLLFGKLPHAAPIPTLRHFADASKSRSLLDLTLRFDAPPEGALRSLWSESSAFVLTNGQKKRIAFLIDVGTNQVRSVLKVPMGPAPTKNVQKEISLLEYFNKSDVRLAPSPQAAGYLKSQDTPKRFYYTCQSYLVGERPRGLRSLQVAQFLAQLRLKNEQVSLYDLAQLQMRRMLEADLASDVTRDGVLRLLDRITDKTPRAASLIHGDLRPSNLVLGKKGNLKAIDWEFCDRKGLEIIDFSHLVLDRAYTSSDSKTFSQIFSADHCKIIQNYASAHIPGPKIHLPQALALQYAQHFLDRYLGFDRWETDKLRRLSNALQSDWPFG